MLKSENGGSALEEEIPFSGSHFQVPVAFGRIKLVITLGNPVAKPAKTNIMTTNPTASHQKQKTQLQLPGDV